jgi:predicted nucleic acid-binding protein
VTPERGLLDTSVVVGLDTIDIGRLSPDSAISALTLAELAGGPVTAADGSERARRQERIQQAEAAFESIPFDPYCARAYGRVYSTVAASGRKPRGPRMVDLMIAATALAHQIPLYTLNFGDLRGLEGLVEIVDLAQ